jgi:hypothetical protein
VSFYAVERRGEEPELENRSSLELRGTLTEPIVFYAYSREKVEVGTARPASVAAIIQIRPHVDVVIAYPHLEFDRLWALVLAGQAKHAYLSCTGPRYRRALVTNVSFSSEPEE